MKQLNWLTVYDPATGAATRVAGAWGLEHDVRQVSWMPMDLGAQSWRIELEKTGIDLTSPLTTPDTVTFANQINFGIVAVDLDDGDSAVRLGAMVEEMIDAALVVEGTDGRGW